MCAHGYDVRYTLDAGYKQMQCVMICIRLGNAKIGDN